MYIGPWQEYNLSKAKQSDRSNLNRAAVEKALISTLDPQAAKQAIAALFPRQENSAYSSERIPSSKKPNIQHLPRIQRTQESESPASFRSSVSEPTRLPSQRYPLSGREKVLDSKDNHPKYPALVLPQLPRVSVNSSSSVSSKTSSNAPSPMMQNYNAAEMLAILKLDSDNAKHIKKPNYAHYWSWKDKVVEEKKQLTVAEKRVQRMQQMKEIYALNSAEYGASNDEYNAVDRISPRIPTSPISKRQVSQIPGDSNLTARDFDVVSKYFTSNNINLGDNISISNVRNHSTDQEYQLAPRQKKPTLSPIQANPAPASKVKESVHPPVINVPISDDLCEEVLPSLDAKELKSPVRQAVTSRVTAPMLHNSNEYYSDDMPGSFEQLLQWSLNLNADDI